MHFIGRIPLFHAPVYLFTGFLTKYNNFNEKRECIQKEPDQFTDTENPERSFCMCAFCGDGAAKGERRR